MPSESPSYEELKGISASRGMLAQFSYPTLFEAKTPTSQPSTLVGCFETPQNCCRCGINFTPSKEYSPVESPPERVCRFHKRRIKRVGRSKVYECCNSTVGSTEGCEVRKWHVFEGYKRGDPFPRYPKLESTKSDLIRKAVALDAEMFYTTGGYEVSRVTVVDFFTEETIIDVMVLPRHPIVLDYNTQFSGVTAESYTSGELPVLEFAELKEKLAEIIGDSTILIGHSIDNDLQLLEVTITCMYLPIYLCM